MNWLKNFVRPKLQKLVGSGKDIPENLWHKCPECTQMIFHRDLDKNLHVCQHCGHHMRISAQKRLEMLFDDGAFQKVEAAPTVEDPLKFRDRRKYTDRLKESRTKTGNNDALVVAHSRIPLERGPVVSTQVDQKPFEPTMLFLFVLLCIFFGLGVGIKRSCRQL